MFRTSSMAVLLGQGARLMATPSGHIAGQGYSRTGQSHPQPPLCLLQLYCQVCIPMLIQLLIAGKFLVSFFHVYLIQPSTHLGSIRPLESCAIPFDTCCRLRSHHLDIRVWGIKLFPHLKILPSAMVGACHHPLPLATGRMTGPANPQFPVRLGRFHIARRFPGLPMGLNVQKDHICAGFGCNVHCHPHRFPSLPL